MTPASGNVQVMHSKGGVHVTADEGDESNIVEARLMPQRARAIAQAMTAAADAAEQWQREHGVGIDVPVRTPETVLRAMLRAYEAALLFAMIRRVSGEDIKVGWLLMAVSEVRHEAACVAANIGRSVSLPQAIRFDYEARLSGARALDAPPMEEP